MRVMSADWTTCRVVRDRAGDLWFRIRGDMWFDGDVRIGSEGLGSNYGPLTPVLDAKGLPAVTTVGDLTARHIGHRVRVLESTWRLFEVAYRLNEPVDLVLEGVTGNLHFANVNPDTPCEVLDTPCEVLSLTEGADRPEGWTT